MQMFYVLYDFPNEHLYVQDDGSILYSNYVSFISYIVSQEIIRTVRKAPWLLQANK